MAGQAARAEKHYTWADYRAMPEETRAEIIDGEFFDMSAAPALLHQHVVGALHSAFGAFFNGHPCTVFLSPVDVKLDDDTVVQPDLLVVCNREQMQVTHIEGPPSLVVEILSPHSHLHDRWRKMRRYAAAGLAEYWIVDPVAHLIEIYLLDGASYRLYGNFGPGETARSAQFKALEVAVDTLFRFPPEPVKKPGQVREKKAVYRVRRKR